MLLVKHFMYIISKLYCRPEIFKFQLRFALEETEAGEFSDSHGVNR